MKQVAFVSLLIAGYGLLITGSVSAACDPPRDYRDCMEQHPDINLKVRGWEPTLGPLSLFYFDHPIDPKGPPQLTTLIEGVARPAVNSLNLVYKWDWTTNQPSSETETIPDVPPEGYASLVGFSAGNNNILVPESGYDLGGGYEVFVLYADDDSMTLKYTCEDNVIIGYAIHLMGFDVDDELLALYNQLDQAGRNKLPILKAGMRIGSGRGELLVSVRDSGSFMDPRWENDWWQSKGEARGFDLELESQLVKACPGTGPDEGKLAYSIAFGEPFEVTLDQLPGFSFSLLNIPDIEKFKAQRASGEKNILTNALAGFGRLSPKRLLESFQLSSEDEVVEGWVVYPLCDIDSLVLPIPEPLKSEILRILKNYTNEVVQILVPYKIPKAARLASVSRALSGQLGTGPAIRNPDLRVRTPERPDVAKLLDLENLDCDSSRGIRVPNSPQTLAGFRFPGLTLIGGLFLKLKFVPVTFFTTGEEVAHNYYQKKPARSGPRVLSSGSGTDAGFVSSFIPKKIPWYDLADERSSAGKVEEGISDYDYKATGGLNCAYHKFQKMIQPKKVGWELPEECE